MKRVLKSLLLAGAALAVLAIARPASAQTLNLQATVIAACRITASPAINFGNYDPVGANNATTGADIDVDGSVDFRCTRGQTAHISMDNGRSGARHLTNATTDFLTYELYQNAGRTTVWGSGAGNWLVSGPTTSAAAVTVPVYARLFRGQDAAVGVYQDTVNVTVTP